MSEFWLCFNCCIAEQPQPKRRRRIDRSMIGEPTNFVHTSHVGSGDIFSGMNSCLGTRLKSVQPMCQLLSVASEKFGLHPLT
uniref:CRIB domain-containing protein n=1 Tax=Oncorhynchus tshawytscha TaxID=74940 RepID=A0AAZ3P8X5_ONCTS